MTTHIYLILFPIFLDILLWFGPHMRVKNLLSPLETMIYTQLSQANSQDTAKYLETFPEMWKILTERFNLFMLARTYPVGIPSLFSSTGVIKNPLGNPPMIEVTTSSQAFLIWILVLIAGFLGGAIFFFAIARAITSDTLPFHMKDFAGQLSQLFLFVLGLWLLVIFLSIPFFFFFTLISLISRAIMQISFILIIILAAWLVIPLVFIPQGIVIYRFNVITSALTSLRVVRHFLPGTGLFLLIAVLLSQGMDLLWTIAPEDSWMTLVGVLGHAFVSTSILTTSFIYYRGGVEWMREKYHQSYIKQSAV